MRYIALGMVSTEVAKFACHSISEHSEVLSRRYWELIFRSFLSTSSGVMLNSFPISLSASPFLNLYL